MLSFIAFCSLLGLGARLVSSANNETARENNANAKKMADEAADIANKAKQICSASISELAKEKTYVLKGNMKKFVKNFSRIKPVNFRENEQLFELINFGNNDFNEIQLLVSSVNNISINDVVGGISGTVLAVGAADIISGGALLSGAGISIGGLTGGAALGAIAAPIFAFSSICSVSESAKNLEESKTNLIKAQAFKEECETYSIYARAVSDRCDLFYRTLSMLNDRLFTDAVNKLVSLVKSKRSLKNFFRNISGKPIYTKEEIQMVASVAVLAKMVKQVIDTNIVDTSTGMLTDESKNVALAIQDRMLTDDLSVELPIPA